MTLKSMQWHESVTLHHNDDDFRRINLVQLVEPHVQGKRVLDMRTLTGSFSVKLLKKGFEIYGLDGYQEAVDMANAKASENGFNDFARHWDLTEIPEPFCQELYDTVICLDVLNHVPDDQSTLTQIREILKPQGRLILAVPALKWMLGVRDKSLGHLRRYEKRELEEMLKTTGFEIEQVRFWSFSPVPLYFFIEKVLNKKLSDGVRYARHMNSLPNKFLGWWYKHVESRVALPFGLTLIAVARKAKESSH